MTELIINYEIHLWVLGEFCAETIQNIPPEIRVWHYAVKHDHHSGHQRYWRLTPKLKKLKKELPSQQRFDVVLGMSLFPGYLPAILYNQVEAKVKYLFLQDEALINFRYFKSALKNLINLCFFNSTCLVSVSKDLLDSIQNTIPSSTHQETLVLAPLLNKSFIGNGSHSEISDNSIITRGPTRLFTAARLVSGKNILRCVEIHNRLKKAGIQCVWQIAGEGPEYQLIQKKIRQYGLEQEFLLLGHRTDIPQLMSEADLFILLSNSEGCPTVVIEALYCSCPVITTSVNGVGRYIKDGKNGFIVDHTIEDQKDKLQYLLENPAKLIELKRYLKNHPPAFNEDLPIFMNQLEMQIKMTSDLLPSVLIAIPTYNQAHYIDQAISSALMQNYDNLIVYVLDDCSSDQTEKQIQKWLTDPRLHYIRHPKNIGRCANYRYAVNHLKDSNWMMILDGDDYYTDPNFIKKAMTLSKIDESIAFIQAGHTTYHDDDSQEAVAILPDMAADYEIFAGVHYLQHWFKTGFFSHLGIIFNQSKARACQMYQENISSSDMESFMRLAKEGAVLVMNTSVGHWRQHANNTSRQLKTVDVAPNVKIFRTISNQWITDGLAKRSDFEPSLTQYEARTYAYLYQQALQEKNIVHTPKDLFKSIWEVNPALLMQRKIIKLIFKVILSNLRRP